MGGVTTARFIIPREVLDMHPQGVFAAAGNEERGKEIWTRLCGGVFRNENARAYFPAAVGCVRRGMVDRPARANIAPVPITLVQMIAIARSLVKALYNVAQS